MFFLFKVVFTFESMIKAWIDANEYYHSQLQPSWKQVSSMFIHMKASERHLMVLWPLHFQILPRGKSRNSINWSLYFGTLPKGFLFYNTCWKTLRNRYRSVRFRTTVYQESPQFDTDKNNAVWRFHRCHKTSYIIIIRRLHCFWAQTHLHVVYKAIKWMNSDFKQSISFLGSGWYCVRTSTVAVWKSSAGKQPKADRPPRPGVLTNTMRVKGKGCFQTCPL